MRNIVVVNVLMNGILALLMVFLNMWALQNNFEETFVSLALFYGIAVILLNAFFLTTIARGRL